MKTFHTLRGFLFSAVLFACSIFSVPALASVDGQNYQDHRIPIPAMTSVISVDQFVQFLDAVKVEPEAVRTPSFDLKERFKHSVRADLTINRKAKLVFYHRRQPNVKGAPIII